MIGQMETYDILVRNEMTGEMATITVESSNNHDAQVEALVQCLRAHGWRRATAFCPDDDGSPVRSEEAAEL